MKQLLVLKQICTSSCICKKIIPNWYNCFIYLHLQAKAGALNWRSCIEKRKMSGTLFFVKSLLPSCWRKFQPLPSLCNCQSESVLTWEWISLLLFTVENPGAVVVWTHTDPGSGWYSYLLSPPSCVCAVGIILLINSRDLKWGRREGILLQSPCVSLNLRQKPSTFKQEVPMKCKCPLRFWTWFGIQSASTNSSHIQLLQPCKPLALYII